MAHIVAFMRIHLRFDIVSVQSDINTFTFSFCSNSDDTVGFLRIHLRFL